MVLVVVSCGGSSDGADVGTGASSEQAQAQQIQPGPLAGEVVVGEDSAWVVSSQGGPDAEIDLWRLEPGTPDPEHVGTVPPLQGASTAATADGLDLAGWRCAEGAGGEMSSCDAAVAELVRVGPSGEVVDEVVLADKAGPLDPSDSAAIVGTTAGSTWVAVEESIVEVGASGEVLATVPTSWGENCVIDDRLYGLVDPDVPTGGSPGAIVTDGGQAGDVTSFQVLELAGGSTGWRPVPGTASKDFDEGEPVAGFCSDGQFVVTTPAGDLVATWRPDTDWSEVATGVDNPPAAAVEGESAQGSFVVLNNGSVVERASDGDYEPTDLDLPAPSGFDPRSGPVVVSADASDSLVAACVTWPETPETATTTCDLTRR